MDKLERVARAIAQNGFGRDWDDFLPVNAHDTDRGDLMEYARAAIAVLEPVSVQEAAIMVADHIDQDMNAANRMIDKFANISLQMPARHWLSQCLRALAEKDK